MLRLGCSAENLDKCLRLFSASAILMLAGSCDSTVDSFDEDTCYVMWDGKAFVEGKTSGEDFVRFEVDRYGVNVLEVSIPRKMAEYFGGKNLKKGDTVPQDLKAFVLEQNIEKLSSICDFRIDTYSE